MSRLLCALSYQDQIRMISLEYSEQSRGRRIPDGSCGSTWTR
jgi:hypothetical protein